jgi:hypothetical protein
MSALCIENFTLGQGINECLFMFRPKDKFSMHNTLIYVLSSGQVIHAQGTHLCPVLRTNIDDCLVH